MELQEQPPLLTETPQQPPEPTPPSEIEAPLSIADHAAQFDPKRDKSKDAAPEEPLAPLAADATPEQRAAHHSEQQRREKTGEFKTGKKRHRAASQQASAADAPRIQELTRQIKELQGQIAQPRVAVAPSNGNGHAPAAMPQAPPQQAASAMPTAGSRWLGDPKNDPEPAEADFGGDPMKYLSARFQWEARGVNRYERQEQQQAQAREQVNVTFAARTAPVAQKYADFEQVVGAFDQARKIPAGSLIDQFILTDDNGPEVLYHLASNPQQVDALLQVPVLQQMKHLALLSQRFDTASTPAAAAGVTGSVPRARVFQLAPRPVNPVRTEPQGATTGPPTDGSLSIAEHKKRFAPQGRR